MGIVFDAYLTGTTWTSSSSVSNYLFDKGGTVFTLYSNGGTSAGGTISWTTSWTVNTAGLLTFGVGAQFPTSGGTKSTLNFYQDPGAGTTSMTTSGSNVGSTVTAACTRNGAIVTCDFTTLSVTMTNAALTISTLATQFRPARQQEFAIRVISGGVATPGVVGVPTNGVLQVNLAQAGGLFAAGTGGFNAFTITWNAV